MRKALAVITVLLLVAPVAQADQIGSFFGNLATANTLAKGHTSLGIRVGVAGVNSYVGSIAHGLPAHLEIKLKGGIVRGGAIRNELVNNELAIGVDLKWQVLNVHPGGNPAKTSAPFDLSFGTFAEWLKLEFDGNPFIESPSAMQAGIQMIASYPIALPQAGDVAPYASANVRQEWLMAGTGPSWPSSIDPDFNQAAWGFHGGISWYPRAAPLALFAEYQYDGNDGLFGGVEYIF
jgi:hypothetical protein